MAMMVATMGLIAAHEATKFVHYATQKPPAWDPNDPVAYSSFIVAQGMVSES